MPRLILLLLMIFSANSSENQVNQFRKLILAVINNNAGDIITLANDGGNINATTDSGESLMHLAVKTGSTASIGALGFLKANTEALNLEGLTPIEEAIRNDSASSIKELLSAGATLEKRLFKGDTYLHIAAEVGRNKALLALLDAGHEVDTKNYLNQTPLELALFALNSQGVDILLKRGADIELVSKQEGKSLLEEAVESGNVDLLKIAIKSGMATDRIYKNGDTLIHLIIRSGNATEMLKVLNGRKISLDTKNEDGLAPLHIATDPLVVEALLDMGADVNMTTEEGKTALHIAASNGSLDLVKVLYQHNAGLNIKDGIGNTPLMSAAKNSQLPIVTYLLFIGADPRIKNKYGWSALHYAAEGRSCDFLFLLCVEEIILLIEAGARVNDQDPDGFTPAFVAAVNDKVILLQTLFRRGANLSLLGTKGAGIIHEAAYTGYMDVVSFLIDSGVNVDSKDIENGWTALHYAVERGRKKMVALLLKRGADPTVEAVDGRTPLRLAFENRRLEMAKLLIERGA